MMRRIQHAQWIDFLLILIIGSLVMLVHYQGWRESELVNRDMLPYYFGARDFLQTGTLLDRGDVSSYSSYSPPGTFYFLIPGEILFRDGRLQDWIGNTVLFFGTLFFLYLTAREIAGRGVGLAAALLVALSRVGYQTMWPVGHPLFVVSMLYFLILWIKNRSSPALAVALVIGAFGAYADLGITPFLIVIPCLWLVFRPPVGWRTVLAAAVLGLAIWFPYLRFEAGRGFVDIASIVLRRPVENVWKGADIPPIYCFSALTGEPDMRNDTYLPYIGGPEIEQRVIYPLTGWKNQIGYGMCRILLNVDQNFDTDLFLLGPNRFLNTAVWLIFMAGWSALGWIVLRSWKPVQRVIEIVRQKRWIPLALAVGGAAVLYPLLNPDIVANFAANKSLDRNIFLAVQQARDFIPWIWMAIFLGLFLSVFVPENSPENVILFIAFSFPWIILVFLAEPGRPERFWFIWPLQVILFVVCLRWISERFRRADILFLILVAAAGIAVFPLRFYADKISDGLTHGYAGNDNDQWKVVEFLAEKAASETERSLQIEYWLADSNAPVNPLHPEYRFKDWFDYLLYARSGVKNLSHASTGNPVAGTWEVVDNHVGVPDSLKGLSPIATFGHYSVYQIP